MNVITAVPGWVWAAAAVAVMLIVEGVLWCACVLSSRASRAEEQEYAAVGPCGKWVHVSDRDAAGEDTATPNGGDRQPTVGA